MMLKLLLKKQLGEIFGSYFYNAKKNKGRSRLSVALLFVLFVFLMAGVLGGMFTALSVTVCGPMFDAGAGWLYFALIGLMGVLIGSFGSIFNTFGKLYLAKDNDLLLSLPIPVKYIIISRLLSVYLMGLMYCATALIPAAAVAFFTVGFSWKLLFGALSLLAAVSAIDMALSCALGWCVAKISLKMKHKSLVTTLASLLFLGLYYFFYFKASDVLNVLIRNIGIYGDKIRGSAYFLYVFGRAGEGDALSILAVLTVCFAALVLTWVLLKKTFLSMATAAGAAERHTGRIKPAKEKSPSSALRNKELSRFLGSSNYMLNCGLGTLLLPAFGVALVWKGGSVFAYLRNMAGGIQAGSALLLCTALCLISCMNDMAAPSVSLEGKTFWIVRSLPVSPEQILRAKLSLQLEMGAPGMAAAVLCAAYALRRAKVPWPEVLLCALLSFSFLVFHTLWCLFMGVLFPNLNWSNEIYPVKQSLGVGLGLFGGWGFAVLPCVLYLWKGYRIPSALYGLVHFALLLILSAVLYGWIMTKGARRLEEL